MRNAQCTQQILEREGFNLNPATDMSTDNALPLAADYSWWTLKPKPTELTPALTAAHKDPLEDRTYTGHNCDWSHEFASVIFYDERWDRLAYRMPLGLV